MYGGTGKYLLFQWKKSLQYSIHKFIKKKIDAFSTIFSLNVVKPSTQVLC